MFREVIGIPFAAIFSRFRAGATRHGIVLGWDRAAMDYDADTVVDVISCNTHHRGIRRLQIRVASAAVDPSDCVTTSHCKLSTVLQHPTG